MRQEEKRAAAATHATALWLHEALVHCFKSDKGLCGESQARATRKDRLTSSSDRHGHMLFWP